MTPPAVGALHLSPYSLALLRADDSPRSTARLSSHMSHSERIQTKPAFLLLALPLSSEPSPPGPSV
jgi:hypothetical protein